MEEKKSKKQIKKELKREKYLEKKKQNKEIRQKRERTKKKQIVQNKKVYSIGLHIFNSNLMTDREIRSLVHQIRYIYGYNKNTYNPVNLYLMNLMEIETYLPKEYNKWKVDYSINLEQVKEKLIFLSPDAKEPLLDLNPDKLYVIGGIVDKNRHKKYVLNYCKENNIECRRLPIQECIKLNSCSTLTIPVVFEILLVYAYLKDWKQAFERCIPKRKLARIEE